MDYEETPTRTCQQLIRTRPSLPNHAMFHKSFYKIFSGIHYYQAETKAETKPPKQQKGLNRNRLSPCFLWSGKRDSNPGLQQ